VTISKPGTRFKNRSVSAHPLRGLWEDNEIVNVCPEGNKFLFRMMRDIKKGRFQ
jgi:hypothetical protein